MLRRFFNPSVIHRQLTTQTFITTPGELRPHAKKIYDDVKEFLAEECVPKERDFMEHSMSDNKWEVWPEIEILKQKDAVF